MDLNLQKLRMASGNNPGIIPCLCILESVERSVDKVYTLASDPRIGGFIADPWKSSTEGRDQKSINLIIRGLIKIQGETGLPVGTKISNALQTKESLMAGVDLLWIGSGSVSSPFVMTEIAAAVRGTKAVVMVNNPAIPDVLLWLGALERLKKEGVENLLAVHDGFTPFIHGRYQKDPSWRTVIELRRLLPVLPVLESPCSLADNDRQTRKIAQRSLDLGLNGLIMPVKSGSKKDSNTKESFNVHKLSRWLDHLVLRKDSFDNPLLENRVEELRNQMDMLDQELLEILSIRKDMVQHFKRRSNDAKASVAAQENTDKWIDQYAQLPQDKRLNRELTEAIFRIIQQMEKS